jgi:hypothetical protein
MKRFLIGCGVVALVLFALAVVGGMWVFNNARKMGQKFRASHELLAETNRKHPFVHPPDGLVPENRLVAWIDIHKSAAQRMDEAAKKMENVRGGMAAFKAGMESMNNISSITEEQAKALDQAKMSQKEFNWITGQVMGALDHEAARKDPANAAMIQALTTAPAFPGRRGGTRQVDLMELAAPVTAAQALHLVKLLKPREKDFITGTKSIGQLEMFSGSYTPMTVDRGTSATRAPEAKSGARVAPTPAAAPTRP